MSGYLSFLVGILAMFFTVIKQFKSIICFCRGIKLMNIKNVEYNFILISLLCSGLWTIYGIELKDSFIYITNSILFLINLFFLDAYFFINDGKDNIYKFTGMSLGCWIIIYNLLPKNLAGFFAFIVNICSFYFLIISIKKCLLTKEMGNLSLFETQMSIISTFFWVLYGLFFTHLPLIWIPNLIELFIMILNLLLFYWIIGKIDERNFIIDNLIKLLHIGEFISPNNKHIVENTNNLDQRLKDDFLHSTL